MLVQNGMPASVHFQALSDGDRAFTGPVTRSTYSFDERARTLMTEIDLPNTPKKELRPGMYANVTITAEIPSVWTLPNEAILSDEGGKFFCFCVENGKAVRTPIRAGVRTGRFTQLVKKQSKAATLADTRCLGGIHRRRTNHRPQCVRADRRAAGHGR